MREEEQCVRRSMCVKQTCCVGSSLGCVVEFCCDGNGGGGGGLANFAEFIVPSNKRNNKANILIITVS